MSIERYNYHQNKIDQWMIHPKAYARIHRYAIP